MTDGFEETRRGGWKAPESAVAVLFLVTENRGQWLPRQSGRGVNGGLNAGLIHFTDSKFKAAEPHATKNSINLWSPLKHVQHGFMEKALTLAARHAASLVSVTVFSHWEQHWTKYGHPGLCCHGYLGHSSAWWITSRLL